MKRIGIVTWVIALGVTGFAAGFFGPMLLNPEANQGPLVGILLTGPGGLIAGAVLGAIARLLPLSERVRALALTLVCAALALATLYFCLPQPKVRGYIIEASIAQCSPAIDEFAASLADWEKAVARTTWAHPAQNWQATARANVRRERGAILTLHIERQLAIFEHRRPWNRGQLTSGEWQSTDTEKRYYADDAGDDCAAYLARKSERYWPFTASGASADSPPRSWPPLEPADFLGVQQLGAVPARYDALAH